MRSKTPKDTELPTLPPCDTTAEQSALGAMMLGGFEATATGMRLLDPGDFYRDAHAEVFRAMLDLHRSGKPCDAVTLKDALAARGTLESAGGVSYILALGEVVPTTANLPHYAVIIKEKAARRFLLESAARLSGFAQAEDVPVSDTLATMQRAHAEGIGKLAANDAPATVCIADVEAEAVSWLWKGRVAFGKLAILDGDPGLGKSTLSLDLAARVSTGAPMPEEKTVREPANVLLLCAEDGAADTIRPRLDAAGANLRRVFLLEGIPEGQETRPVYLPNDSEAIRAAIIKHAAKFVIIDPILAFIPGESNANNGQDVRRALMPLVRIAEETGAAILILRHLNKGGGVGANALYRGGGSMQFAGTARLVLLVTADPDDADRRVLAPVKNNLSRFPDSLYFSLVSDQPDAAGRVRWEGVADQTANGLLAAGIAASQPARADREYSQDKAGAFLAEQLAGGAVVATRDLLTRAKAAGIGERALATTKDAAKKSGELEYFKRKEGDATVWYCKNPMLRSATASASDADSPNDATLQPCNSATLQDDKSENDNFTPYEWETVCNTKDGSGAVGNSASVTNSVADLHSCKVAQMEGNTSCTVALDDSVRGHRVIIEEITRHNGVVSFELAIDQIVYGSFDTKTKAINRWQRFLQNALEDAPPYDEHSDLADLGQEVDAELSAYFNDTPPARKKARSPAPK